MSGGRVPKAAAAALPTGDRYLDNTHAADPEFVVAWSGSTGRSMTGSSATSMIRTTTPIPSRYRRTRSDSMMVTALSCPA
jgi:hypothetical protein